MIRFPTNYDAAALPDLFVRMTSIVDWSTWQRRNKGLRADVGSNPLWDAFIQERHGLELAFGNAHAHFRVTGRYPWPPRTAEEYRLYSFMAVAVQVHAHLSSQGQTRFIGAIRSALEKEAGLGPVVHEMTAVAHLMGLGFDIEFNDLECGGGFDFLAAQNSTRIEVECKHISADIGRKIHRRNLHALGKELLPVTNKAVDVGSGGRLVEVTLPDGLSTTTEQKLALSERIEAVLTGSASLNDDVCAISVRSFPLESSPFAADRTAPSIVEIVNFLKAAFSINDAHVVLNWRSGQAAILLHFRSRKPDKVLHSLFRRLKDDAKRQFSGTLPAFLCVHLADVTEQQLLELAQEEEAGRTTGLARLASMLLLKRPHLHSIAMMAGGAVRIERQRSGAGMVTSVQETGPSYVFRNPGHPAGGNPLLQRVFV